jgi:hypothetical protein
LKISYGVGFAFVGHAIVGVDGSRRCCEVVNGRLDRCECKEFKEGFVETIKSKCIRRRLRWKNMNESW